MSARHVGSLVRRTRKKAGLTGVAVAAALGMTRQGLGKIESGEVGVSLAVAARICEVLKVAPWAIMAEVRK